MTWVCVTCAGVYEGIADASRHARHTQHLVMRAEIAEAIAERVAIETRARGKNR